MLIHEENGIRVYVAPIPSTPGGCRSDAEKSAITSLLSEAFPTDTPAVGHYLDGAPLLLFPPQPSSPEMTVSISHSLTMAAIAIAPAGRRIGIDCEDTSRRGQLERVASRYLSPSQRLDWGSFPASLAAWTIKEALYKAARTPGLPLVSIPLPGLSTPLPPLPLHDIIRLQTDLNGIPFKINIMQSPESPDSLIALVCEQ